MKKTLFTILTMLIGFSAFAQNTDDLLNSYIKIKNALVQGDNQAADNAISTLSTLIEKDKTFYKQSSLSQSIQKLNKTGSNLEEQRAAFNAVSVALWELLKSEERTSSPLYYQYCPMKKAYWVSVDEKIENPYYGASMMSCGKVVETGQ